MIPRTFFDWVDTTQLAVLERDTTWGFAVTSIFHLFGLILLLVAVMILSLRLFGWCMRDQSISQVAQGIWKWSVGGLLLMLVSGVGLFAAEAPRCYDSGPFWFKMEFLAAAIVFHFTMFRVVGKRDDSGLALRAITGMLAIVLWLGVGVGGRAIGFF